MKAWRTGLQCTLQ